jgi:DnaK suppressor protein
MNRPPSILDGFFIARQRQRLETIRVKVSSAKGRDTDEDLAIDWNARNRASESEDQAQDSTISDNHLALIDDLSRYGNSIDRALAKIDEGTYGFSDESGLPIPLARLAAYPQAIRTVSEEARYREDLQNR